MEAPLWKLLCETQCPLWLWGLHRAYSFHPRNGGLELELAIGIGIIDGPNDDRFSGSNEGTAIDLDLTDDRLRTVLLGAREVAEIAADIDCNIFALFIEFADMRFSTSVPIAVMLVTGIRSIA